MAPIHFDRRLNIILILSGVVLVGMLLFAIFAVPAILSTDSTTSAIAAGNDTQACRSSFRLTLVDEPMARILVAKADLDEQTNAGLEASVRGDDEALAMILASLPALRDNLESAAQALTAGIAEHHQLIDLSRTSPAQFLARCRETSS